MARTGPPLRSDANASERLCVGCCGISRFGGAVGIAVGLKGRLHVVGNLAKSGSLSPLASPDAAEASGWAERNSASVSLPSPFVSIEAKTPLESVVRAIAAVALTSLPSVLLHLQHQGENVGGDLLDDTCAIITAVASGGGRACAGRLVGGGEFVRRK